MNVLVTGANGYLGGWVVQELTGEGHETLAMDSHGRPHLSHGLPRLPVASGLELRAALEWAGAVVHLAWYSKAGDGQPRVQSRCLDSSLSLFRAVREADPGRRVVFASTAAVYGDRATDEPVTEATTPVPNCAYGRAKLEAEDHLRTRLPNSLSFRFGGLMGVGAPGGRTKLELCVNSMASSAYRRGVVEVWNPEAFKPVLHVRDAARLIAWAVGPSVTGPLNAASLSYFKARTIAEDVAYAVTRDSGQEVRVTTVPDGSGPRSCVLDCTQMWVRAPQGVLLDFRSLGDTIREFRKFVPTPECYNDPARWGTVGPVSPPTAGNEPV